MKQVIIFLSIVAIAVFGLWYVANAPTDTGSERNATSTTSASPGEDSEPREPVETVATGLEIPWGIAFLPGGTMLVTERPGRLVEMDLDGQEQTRISVSGVAQSGEGGLLGIVLHPEFDRNRQLYLYMTQDTDEGVFENRVVRYRYQNGELSDERVILRGIEGARYHDGGRMEFGPDGLLYITTGDAGLRDPAQNTNSLSGKTLRVHPDGSVPSDNPFRNEIYSYGHRNSQGLAWDDQGRLWSTEHGRSGIVSGMDEVNVIKRGGNYGWPNIEGDETQEGMTPPAAHSGSEATWAPASATYWDGSIFFGGLRGAAVYEAVLNGENVTDIRRHFFEEFGRVRTTRIGPDGMMYITTSNRDGRGEAGAGDDKIIRIDPEQAFR